MHGKCESAGPIGATGVCLTSRCSAAACTGLGPSTDEKAARSRPSSMGALGYTMVPPGRKPSFRARFRPGKPIPGPEVILHNIRQTRFGSTEGGVDCKRTLGVEDFADSRPKPMCGDVVEH